MSEDLGEKARDLGILDARFLNDVVEETNRARMKFNDPVHTLAALTEEVGELAQALLDLDRRPRAAYLHMDIWKEAIQVATMALRVACEGDADFKHYVPDELKKVFWPELKS